MSQRNRDSLLATLVKLDIADTLPDGFLERLALEDIVIPDMRRTMEFARLQTEHNGVFPREKNYAHLTNNERWIAERLLAPRAWEINAVTRPELYKHFQSIFAKIGITEDNEPRIVCVDSDIAAAHWQPSSIHSGSLIYTSKLREILPDRCFNAAMYHEMLHARKRPMTGLKRFVNSITGSFVSRLEEYAADAFAAKHETPDAMVDALVLTREHYSQLNRFNKQFSQLCLEFKDDLKNTLRNPDLRSEEMPDSFCKARIWFNVLASVPEAKPQARGILAKLAGLRTHPSDIDRFDHMYRGR